MRSKKILINFLKRFVEAVSVEYDKNAEFAQTIDQLLADASISKHPSVQGRKELGAKPIAELYNEWHSRDELQFTLWLVEHPVSILQATIRSYELDARKQAARWNDPKKIADFIVDKLRTKAARGSAFIKNSAKNEETNMEKIIIKYERYVPKSIIQDFVKNADIKATLVYAGDVEHFDYAEGQTVADVTLLLTNPIFQGVISNLLFSGLVVLYRKLKKSKDKESEKLPPSLDLEITTPTYNAKFSLTEKLPEEQIETCFKLLEKLVTSSEIQAIAKNPDYDSKESNKPTSLFEFHIDKNIWLPYNFSKDTFWVDADRRAKERLD
jgi:hypothetical protein